MTEAVILSDEERLAFLVYQAGGERWNICVCRREIKEKETNGIIFHEGTRIFYLSRRGKSKKVSIVSIPKINFDTANFARLAVNLTKFCVEVPAECITNIE
jgi:hypothetical protein